MEKGLLVGIALLGALMVIASLNLLKSIIVSTLVVILAGVEVDVGVDDPELCSELMLIFMPNFSSM